MGQPLQSDVWRPAGQSIAGRGAAGELKHLSSPTRRNQPEIPRVVASEMGGAQTSGSSDRLGLEDQQQSPTAKAKVLERTATAGESPVASKGEGWAGILSTTGHEKPCGKLGGPPSKAQHLERPIVDQYREGKVKSTPKGG
jgi:hypothetical protein